MTIFHISVWEWLSLVCLWARTCVHYPLISEAQCMWSRSCGTVWSGNFQWYVICVDNRSRQMLDLKPTVAMAGTVQLNSRMICEEIGWLDNRITVVFPGWRWIMEFECWIALGCLFSEISIDRMNYWMCKTDLVLV